MASFRNSLVCFAPARAFFPLYWDTETAELWPGLRHNSRDNLSGIVCHIWWNFSHEAVVDLDEDTCVVRQGAVVLDNLRNLVFGPTDAMKQQSNKTPEGNISACGLR
jgi:hypothetical protein